MNTIRVYGTLAKYLGRNVFEAEIRTAAEALRFLGANFPGLRQHVLSQRYVIAVGRHLLTATELLHPIGSQELRIIPVFTGAAWEFLNPSGGTSNPNNVPVNTSQSSSSSRGGGGGGGGFNFAQFALQLGTALFGIAPAVAVAAVGVGLSYAASSLSTGNPSNLQSSSSGSPRPAGPRESFSFSGIQNTTRQGVPIPVVYGETIVGSVVISAGIDTEQVKV